MSAAGRSAVGIDEVDVSDPATAVFHAGRDAGLFDVHVEEIRQQSHVVRLERLHQRRACRLGVDEIGLVPIERFVNERDVVATGMFTEVIQRGFQPVESLLLGNAFAPTTLHRTDDGRCAVWPAEVDHRTNEVCGTLSRLGIRTGETQLVLHPTGTRADGSQSQRMRLQQRREFTLRDRIRARRKQLDGIETQLGCVTTGGGQIVPKHKRTTLRFGNKTDRDSRLHGRCFPLVCAFSFGLSELSCSWDCNSSRTSIRTTPSMFRPLPSPPSDQYVSSAS